MPGFGSHPWEKLIKAERDAEKLYTDPEYVGRVLDYYSVSLDKSTILMARTVVTHAMFETLAKTIHGGA